MINANESKSMRRILVLGFIVTSLAIFLRSFLIKSSRADSLGFRFEEDLALGVLTVMDGRLPVLAYRFGEQLPPGLDSKQARSCYIHPLYSLDGEVLTADFPGDHLHHHGLFWTWPAVMVRGEATQTWHPAEPSLRQHFVRWVKRETSDAGALIVVENAWELSKKEVVATETVSIMIRRASHSGRTMDVEIILRPIGGTIELRGAAEANKGYGGFCFRGAPPFKGAALTTDEGRLEKDSTGRPFRWADLSTPDFGIAVFVSPDHPGFPVAWLVRASYAGVLNPSWPGLAGVTLAPDSPVSLRYRVYIHRGDVQEGRVKEAYDEYLERGGHS